MVVDDRTRIRHMLDAAREAVGFAAGHGRADLDRNRQLTLALLKSLEIVGEAAARVTEAMRTRYPGIPWADVVGMRNRLVHTYFDIDLNLVWDTVTRDLPPLIAELEKLDPPQPPR
jgi:uncharacterized protein with HEPN domain